MFSGVGSPWWESQSSWAHGGMKERPSLVGSLRQIRKNLDPQTKRLSVHLREKEGLFKNEIL